MTGDGLDTPYNTDPNAGGGGGGSNGPGSSLYDAVAQIFKTATGRDPSPAEVQAQIAGGSGDLGSIQQGIYASPEAQAYSQRTTAANAAPPTPTPTPTPTAAPGPSGPTNKPPAGAKMTPNGTWIVEQTGTNSWRDNNGQSWMLDAQGNPMLGSGATPPPFKLPPGANPNAPPGTDYGPGNPAPHPGPTPPPGPAPPPGSGPPPGPPGSNTVAPPGGTFTAPTYTKPPAFTYSDFTPTSPDAVFSDPSYMFRFGEGQNALSNSAAARGVLNTGGTLKDFINYGQNAASQEFQNVDTRRRADYTLNRGNALDTYNTNYGTQFKDPYQIADSNALNSFLSTQHNSDLLFGANENRNVIGVNAAQHTTDQNQYYAQHNVDQNKMYDWQKFVEDYNQWRNNRLDNFDMQYKVTTA